MKASFDDFFLERAIALQDGAIPPHLVPSILSPEQYWAASAILANPGITFLTGGAGTGKTRLLKYLIEECPWPLKSGLRVAAPTGTAALAVGGFTIHSLFGIQVWNGYPKRPNPENPRRGGYNPNLRLKVLRSLKFLIVDEVSMVRADIMDTMDRALRNAKNNDEPFGGIKVLLVGDPFQLPPVQDAKWKRSTAPAKYGKGHFFQSDVIKCAEVLKLKLSTIHRQGDSQFTQALNLLREGKVTPITLATFNSAKIRKDPPQGCLVLFPKNKPVAIFNAQKLAQLPGETHVFWASRSGSYSEKSPDGTYKKSELDDPLELKVGAQVMFMKNDDQGAPKDSDGLPIYRWTNGTLGLVEQIGSEWVKVRFRSPHSNKGVVEKVQSSTWEDRIPVADVFGRFSDELVGTFTQIPLRLAWGATIHKAQGATYDTVHLDLRAGTFESGHSYVAMSRVRSLDGLSLSEPFDRRNLNPVDQAVVDFMVDDGFFGFPDIDYEKHHRLYLKSQERQARKEAAQLQRQRLKQAELEKIKEIQRIEAEKVRLERRNGLAKNLEERVIAAISGLDSHRLGIPIALVDLVLVSNFITSPLDPRWSSANSRSERWLDVLSEFDRNRFLKFAKSRIAALQSLLMSPDLELGVLHAWLSLGMSAHWHQFTSGSPKLLALGTPANATRAMRAELRVGSMQIASEYARVLRALVILHDAS